MRPIPAPSLALSSLQPHGETSTPTAENYPVATPYVLFLLPQGASRTGTSSTLDAVLRAARETGRLRLLRHRGSDDHLKSVQLGTVQWERLQTRLLSRLTAALREALEGRDEARAVQAVVGFVDAGSVAEAEQWIRVEWVAPRLGPRLRDTAGGGERDAFARVCAEVSHRPKLEPSTPGRRMPEHNRARAAGGFLAGGRCYAQLASDGIRAR
jgi:hypothetical protein